MCGAVQHSKGMFVSCHVVLANNAPMCGIVERRVSAMHCFIAICSGACLPIACRCLTANVPDALLDAYTRAYDVYRRSLTANRLAYHPASGPEMAMNWARGWLAKYHMHHDTALRLMLQTGKYYLSPALAKAGAHKDGGNFDPIKLDMCASIICMPRACLCTARRHSSPAYGSHVVFHRCCGLLDFWFCCHRVDACGSDAHNSLMPNAQGMSAPYINKRPWTDGFAVCRCTNSLAYPAAVTLDDIQTVLYGSKLGLSLPARDPWSYTTPEVIKSEDVPWLDEHFRAAGGVSVVDRLSAFMAAADAPAGPDFEGPPADVRQLRFHSPAPRDEDDDMSRDGQDSVSSGDEDGDAGPAGDDHEVSSSESDNSGNGGDSDNSADADASGDSGDSHMRGGADPEEGVFNASNIGSVHVLWLWCNRELLFAWLLSNVSQYLHGPCLTLSTQNSQASSITHDDSDHVQGTLVLRLRRVR